MSYASLMVYADGDTERIHLAVDLASRFQAKLIGIAARAPAPVVTGESPELDVKLAEQETVAIRAFLDESGRHFRALAGKCPTPIEWRSAPDFPHDYVAREARAADLVVIGQTSTYRSVDPGSLLLKAGRPVLVVPAPLARLAARRVVVAWKDARESRRAVRDAIPFLQGAESVTLVEICGWGGEGQALRRLKDVTRFLGDHRVTSVAERVLPDEPIAGDVLLRFIREQQADLIVAGAYGHSRLGEWIFGGVTRDLLAGSPICCLLSH